MDFQTKFDIIYTAVKHKLVHFEVNDSLYEELIDLICSTWTDELFNNGTEAIYEHLRYSSCPPIQEWSLMKLLDQFVDETQDYWDKEYQEMNGTMCYAHRRLNEVIDQTFTPIELTKLVGKLKELNIQLEY